LCHTPGRQMFWATSISCVMLLIASTSRIKDLSVFFDAKLYFHNYVHVIISECIKLLGLIRSITFRFSSLECLYALYFTSVRSKLEYASVVWNSITSTDANKLERIQQKFASVCFYRFFPPHVPYSYTLDLEKLSLSSLRKRRHHFDAFFFCSSLSWPSVTENVSLRVSTRNIRDFSKFSVCPSNKHCPSARHAYSANVVLEDLDIFAIGAVSLNHIYTHQPKIVNNIHS
jgi:hypothetical protein